MSRGSWLTAATSILVLALIAAIFPIESEDLPMYLAIAREILARGELPAIDPFLYSIPDYPWMIAHQWLSYLVFHAVKLAGGWTGVVLFKATLLLALPGAVLLMAWRRHSFGAIPYVLVILALSASLWRYVERSANFSEVFTVLTLLVLLECRGRLSRLAYALPAVFILWVNLHPGFIVGLVLVALKLASDFRSRHETWWRRLLGIGALSALVCVLNPRGLDGALYPFVFAGREAKVMGKYFTEWWPLYHPLFVGNEVFWRFCALTALCFGIAVRYCRRPFEIIASIAMLALAVSGVRFLPTSAYALALIAVSALPSVSSKRWLDGAVTVMTLTLAIWITQFGYRSLGWTREFGFGLNPQSYPIDTAAAIEKLPAHWRLFNNHDFGGYLAWRWQGSRQVYFHGFVTDMDFYQNEFIRIARSPEDFAELVQRHDLRILLVDRAQGLPVFQNILRKFPAWEFVGTDSASALWIRRE